MSRKWRLKFVWVEINAWIYSSVSLCQGTSELMAAFKDFSTKPIGPCPQVIKIHTYSENSSLFRLNNSWDIIVGRFGEGTWWAHLHMWSGGCCRDPARVPLAVEFAGLDISRVTVLDAYLGEVDAKTPMFFCIAADLMAHNMKCHCVGRRSNRHDNN